TIITGSGGIDDWAADHNAIFGPAKYQLLDASRRLTPATFQPHKRVPEPRPNLRLGTHLIKPASSVKLLGIHIDQQLRWKEQRAAILRKGQAWLSKVGRFGKPTRSIRPAQMRRLYLATCLPRLLYGADIFLNPTTRKHRASKTRSILPQLRTIQRRAAILITGAMATTATDALNAHANLLPIEHTIDKHRHRAATRLATLPRTHPIHKALKEIRRTKPRKHKAPLQALMEEYDINPLAMEKIAAVRYEPGWEPMTTTEIRGSKEAAIEAEREDEAEWKAYTDGSGIGGHIGNTWAARRITRYTKARESG
ncbi:unnamed protein product, partial [Mycena citricolor]